MSRLQLLLAAGLVCAASACRPPLPASPSTAAPDMPPAAPAVTQAAESPAATQSAAEAGELVKFSGDNDAVSEPFRLEAEEAVEISWAFSGEGAYALWLVNDTEDLTDVSLYRVLLKQGEGGGQEAVQYTLIPGDYHLEVEFAHGPWTVQVRSLE